MAHLPWYQLTSEQWRNNWSKRPQVQVWQAVAISLGIDPNELNCNRCLEIRDFKNRLDVVVSNLNRDPLLKVERGHGGGLEWYHPISLADCGRWLERNDLSITPELQGLARTSKTQGLAEALETISAQRSEIERLKAELALPESSEKFDARERETLLTMVSAMLRLLVGPDGSKLRVFPSQDNLAEAIAREYRDIRGMSPKNIKEKFAMANKQGRPPVLDKPPGR